jgi:hypothetical protein
MRVNAFHTLQTRAFDIEQVFRFRIFDIGNFRNHCAHLVTAYLGSTGLFPWLFPAYLAYFSSIPVIFLVFQLINDDHIDNG